MLRISKQSVGGVSVLRLEGKLLQDWTGELRGQIAAAAGEGRRIRLDLAAVTFVDAAGADLLRELSQSGIHFGPCSGFVTSLLEMRTR